MLQLLYEKNSNEQEYEPKSEDNFVLIKLSVGNNMKSI